MLMRTVFRDSYDAVSASLSVAMAQVVHGVMGLVAETSRDGVFVSYAGFPVQIVPECVGIYEMLIFASAVLAFPTSWAKRGVGLLLGCANNANEIDGGFASNVIDLLYDIASPDIEIISARWYLL